MDYYRFDKLDEIIKEYRNQIKHIQQVVELNKNILDFRPEIKDAWSIKEHLIHICETEINCFIRFRKSIQNPGAIINFGGGDVEIVNKALSYNQSDINLFITLFQTLRMLTLNSLDILSKEQISNYWIMHPDFGHCDIQFILSIYIQHYTKHIGFINRNITWSNKTKET